MTQSSVAKFFSALRALGLQKQNFLRAARARYQRKLVTQSSVVKIFLRAARARYQRKQVTQSSVAKFSARYARQFCKSKIFSALRALEARENV